MSPILLWVLGIFAVLVVLWFVSDRFREIVDGFKTMLWGVFGLAGTSLEMFNYADLVPAGWNSAWVPLVVIVGFGILRIEHARRTKKPIGEQ